MTPKFLLGMIVVTPGAEDAFYRNEVGYRPFLMRHQSGDWGIMDDEDKATNEDALLHEARLFSAYLLEDDTKIWIITEWDRSVTTILLPDEY